MTIFDFFEKHNCNQYEKRRLLVKLAEIRYEMTLELLKKIMRS